MIDHRFPEIDAAAISATRDALHTYARLLGDCLKATRPRRKHWWHASLRPSVAGLSTGIVRAASDFELELDFIASQLLIRTSNDSFAADLPGRPVAELATWIDETLQGMGVESTLAQGDSAVSCEDYSGYSTTHAKTMQRSLAAVAAALETFRAGIREETSPIQLWPHHFDLSMIWLPGNKIPGQDPADEEYSDKQMNFGFVFGDEGIEEPYFYVTAYPVPEALPTVELPAGTTWKSEDFSGAVLLYKDLVATGDPAAYLQDLWTGLLAAGQTHLATDE